MNNRILASTISSSTTYVDALKINTPPVGNTLDILCINYTGDKDIILKIGIDSTTSSDADTSNEILVSAYAGALPPMPIIAYWIKAKHLGSAPTSGNLDVAMLASGM